MPGRPAGRLAPWLVLALTACAVGAAADNYTLSLQPAWDGYVKAGVPSELGIRLLASRGGRAALRLHGAQATIRKEVVFEAEIPLQVYLPLAHDTALPLRVELVVDGQAAAGQSRELQVVPATAEVVAIVNKDASALWPDHLMPTADTIVLYPEASQLPHTGQGYTLLSALFLPESALRLLTGVQQQALAEYVAGCGLLYLSAASSPRAQALRAIAGCSARNLIVAPFSSSELSRQAAVSPPPAMTTIRSLMSEGRDPVLRSVIVFTLGYIMVLLLAVRRAKSASALLILPPAATALAVMAWYLASPGIQLASLAEMDSGDPLARFAGLLQITGAAPGEVVLELPPQLGLPLAAEPETSASISMDPVTGGADLHIDTHLMSRHLFRVEGVVPGTELALENTASGVYVTNRGATPSMSAILAWRGKRYTVPALAAQQQWRQPETAESWGDSAPERWLRQRATDGGSWLLLPHNIPAPASLKETGASTGWLLVRGRVDV